MKTTSRLLYALLLLCAGNAFAATITFNQSNGTLLTATDAHWQGGDLGGAGSANQDVSEMEVQSSALQITNVSTYQDRKVLYVNSQGTIQSSQVVWAAAPASGAAKNVVINMTIGTTNGYEALLTATDVVLYRNGAYDSQYTHGLTVTSTAITVKIAQLSGGVIKVYVQGVERLSLTDGSPISGGSPGIRVNADGTIGRTLITSWTDGVSAAVSNAGRASLLGVGR